MQKTDYVVTDSAGPRVAGRLAASGDTIALSEQEARMEILNGAIRLPDAPAAGTTGAPDGQAEAPSKARKK